MDFKQSLQQYRNGLQTLEQLRETLAAELAQAPESAAACLEWLGNGRAEDWLAPEDYSQLQTLITQTDASLGDAIEDAPTRFHQSSDQGGGQPPAAALNDDNAGGVTPPSTEDATRLRHGPDASQGESPGTASHGLGASGQPVVGTVLGGQFKLEKELGHGGMGVVFKALDIKARAANDRNPYVAIKVLSAEFRNHPDSLIQMQREAKKAQSLAHPNIVNVFIFNFDEHCAWIVMEYLDGYPLDELSGKRLPRNKAMSYIEQMVNALNHAHNMKPHPIVHYDLKPANAFLTDNDVVKLLDFGIARAAPVGRVAAADKTVFDPGALGALTPSYASCEMIRGMEPDPRDDVYGLACVAYFLLTGNHPFDRCPATEAQAARMKPARTPGLSRRQYKALAHALEFVRAKRTRSAAQFLRELKPPENRTAVRTLVAATVALVLAVGASASLWVPWVQEEWQVYQLSKQLPAQGDGELAQSIAFIESLSASDVQRIFTEKANADRLTDYFRRRVEALFDPAEGAYGYAAAKAEIRQLRDILPDAQSVAELDAEMESRRAFTLERLRERATAAVQEERLVATDGEASLPSVLAALRLLDPNDSQLPDSQIAAYYADAVDAALLRENLDRAATLVETGRELVGEAAALNQLGLAESRIEQTRTGSAAEPQASTGSGALSGFNAALAARELASAGQFLGRFEDTGVSPDLAREATRRLAAAYLAEAEKLTTQGELENAATLIASGLALAPDGDIEQSFRTLEQTIGDQQDAAVKERRARAQAAITGVRDELNTRLAAASFGIDDVTWASDTLARLARLGADTGDDRQRVIQRIVASGEAFIASSATAEAFNLGKYADALFPGAVGIRNLNERVEAAIRESREKQAAPVAATSEPGSLASLNEALDALLRKPDLEEPATAGRIRAQLRLLDRNGADMDAARGRVASAALARASEFAAAGQPERASSHRALAVEYGAEIDAEPRRAAPASAATAAPAADLGAVKASFESAIAAGNLNGGVVEYQRLRALSPADDPYITRDAPAKLVEAYIAAAVSAGGTRDYDAALNYLDSALEFAPEDARAQRYHDRFSRLRDAL